MPSNTNGDRRGRRNASHAEGDAAGATGRQRAGFAAFAPSQLERSGRKPPIVR